MELHENAKQRMLTLMSEDLQYLTVKNGKFLDRMSAFLSLYRANTVLPKQGAFARQLEEWVGDLPFIEFCAGHVDDELSLHGQYVAEPERQLLSEIPGYEDVGALAQRLVGLFETLPWQYTLTVELGPDFLPPLPHDTTALPIGEKAKLITSDLLLADEFPLESADNAIAERIKGAGLLAAMLGDKAPSWKTEVAYFQTELEGFVGLYGSGSPMDRATSRLKAFLGLGLALGVFQYEDKYDPSPPRKEWVVHRRNDDAWAVRNKIWLEEDDTRALRALKLWDRFGSKYPAQQKIPWLQSVLARVSAALCSPNSSNLKLAAQWFWDSHKGADEVLRYVRRMTTLEILLGEGADTSEASLGEILGNRLAYLIGKTHKQRSDVLTDLKKIYNIRSRILHRGKHRLMGKERVMMSKLQTLCEEALKEEAKIVAAPDKAEA